MTMSSGSILILAWHSPIAFASRRREKGKDVACLDEAINDAKRQTPACFFIGEIRDSNDWQRAVAFAGTGHLANYNSCGPTNRDGCTHHPGDRCKDTGRWAQDRWLSDCLRAFASNRHP